MNINCSNIGYQQSPSFNGRVDKKSAKLAKEIGGSALENLQNLAGNTSKNTVLKLNEMGSDIGIYAYNQKTGHGLTVGLASKENLGRTVGSLVGKNVDQGIINASVRNIKEAAISGPLNTTEKKFLRQEVKDTLAMQREVGVKMPFWSETKQLMAEADRRADLERIADSKNYHAWKMSMCNDML